MYGGCAVIPNLSSILRIANNIITLFQNSYHGRPRFVCVVFLLPTSPPCIPRHPCL